MRFFCGQYPGWTLLGLGFLALWVAGCARPLPPTNTLRAGIGAEPGTLDPALATGIAENRILSAIYEGLVVSDGVGGVLPGVAQSWKESNDGLSWTFHLRDAAWSDGTPITAQNVIASWRRALTPVLAAPNAAFADAIAGAQDFRQGKCGWNEVGISAPDDRTLIVRLAEPSPTFLATLASAPIFYPVRVDQIAKLGEPTSRATHWTGPLAITNGPFVMRYHKVNHKIVVQKNPRYWDAANVRLRGIEFYPIENRASEEMAFLSGVVDVTIALPLSKVSHYRNSHSPYLRIDPALQVEALLINVRRPPLDKLEVRQALAESIRRAPLCEQVLRAGQAPALSFVPPQTAGGFAPSVKIVENSPDANAWDALGARELVYSYNSSDARKLVAETLQAQLEQTAGRPILTLENLEWKTYLAKRQSRDFDITRLGWSADLDDPSNFLELFTSDSPNNYTGWANPEYDTLVKARRFVEAEAILTRELPVIPLYFNPNVYLISPRVHGWTPSEMDTRPWKKVWVE